jgi:uncharacterized SAM-binding protein YcdF (DUF218 family)
MGRPARSRRKVLATLVGVIASAFVFGFVLFATYATRDVPAAPPRADAIVVLTGGAQRIEAGARLLADDRGARLLISGVNTLNSRDDVYRLTGLTDQAKFECCVDLGYTALDTVGNAEEAMRWSTARGYRSLIVVTASYHMPRSLAELSRFLPGTKLIAYPVLPRTWQREPWYLSPQAIRVLVFEYLKYMPAAARVAAVRLLHPAPTTVTAAGRDPRDAGH